MNEKQAKKILENKVKMEDRGIYSLVGVGLTNLSFYLSWDINDKQVFLDGDFTADELKAIAWWMKNKNTGKILTEVS